MSDDTQEQAPSVEFISAEEWEENLANLAESGNGVSRIPVPRKNGAPSRKQVVAAFQDAFELIGGTPRLAIWANEHPTDFFKLYARLMPSSASVQLDHTGEITVHHVLPRSKLDE